MGYPLKWRKYILGKSRLGKFHLDKVESVSLLHYLYNGVSLVMVFMGKAREGDLLDYIYGQNFEFIKVSCTWKDTSDRHYKSKKANRSILYLLACVNSRTKEIFSKEAILMQLSKMMNNNLICDSAMLLTHVRGENPTIFNSAINLEIYKKSVETNQQLSDREIVYNEQIYAPPYNKEIKKIFDRYLAVSCNTTNQNNDYKLDDTKLPIKSEFYLHSNHIIFKDPLFEGRFPNMIHLSDEFRTVVFTSGLTATEAEFEWAKDILTNHPNKEEFTGIGDIIRLKRSMDNITKGEYVKFLFKE